MWWFYVNNSTSYNPNFEMEAYFNVLEKYRSSTNGYVHTFYLLEAQAEFGINCVVLQSIALEQSNVYIVRWIRFSLT